MLSPFEVSTSSDVGYQARDSMSGSRLNTPLKDIASQVQVMTPEFLSDLAVTDMKDAINLSLNVENASDFMNPNDPQNAGNEVSLNVSAGSPRSRGITTSIQGRDYFQTATPIDTYNTERFTFAPGANNTLFGNASAGGSIDTTTKRARTEKQEFSVSMRFDDRGSERDVWDLNQPLLKHKLAIRWVGLNEHAKVFPKPAFRDQERSFITATFKPIKQISIRGWYEHYEAHAQTVRNSLLKDDVSAWIAAGRPAYDNSGLLNTVSTTAATPWIRETASRTNPYYVMDPSGGVGMIRVVDTTSATNAARTNSTRGLVQTVGLAQLGAPPDNFDHSVIDESIIPRAIDFAGNATQILQRARNFGAVINLNPFKDFYVELGQSAEYFKHRFSDFFRYQDMNLYADANKWAVGANGAVLRDATGALVPNPYFGRYYVEDTFTGAGLALQRLDQQRVSATYQFDFADRGRWLKWLGHYNLTGFYDRLIQDTNQSGQFFDPVLTADVPGGATGTARRPFFRYYLPDAQHPGSIPVNLPFNPLQEGLITLPNTSGMQLYGYNSANGSAAPGGGATNDPGHPYPDRTVVHSHAFAAQGYLLKDRLVLGYSWRKDVVQTEAISSITDANYPRTANGGMQYIDKIYDPVLRDAVWTQTRLGGKTTSNYSVVGHLFPWLSLHYAQLANGQTTGFSRYNLDGSEAEVNSGLGREYGFSLNLLHERLFIRVNKYVSKAKGVSGSPLAGANPVASAIGGGGQLIRNDLPAVEQAALQDGAPISSRFASFDQRLLSIPFNSGIDPSGVASGPAGALRQYYDFLVDRESRGYEVTIVGNPLPQWRVSIAASQNESRENNLAPEYFELIKERLPIWAEHLNAPTFRSAGLPLPLAANQQTLGKLLQAMIGNAYFIQRAAGTPILMDRKYRVTATTRYGFRDGRLKGSYVGGNYIWRSPAAIAFHQLTVSDNPYVVPGLTAQTITVTDPLNPIRGGGLMSFDVFAGYSRRLFKDRVRWDIQLNVRNVLNRDGLIAQRATVTGDPAVFTLQEPRTFILTNTFTY